MNIEKEVPTSSKSKEKTMKSFLKFVAVLSVAILSIVSVVEAQDPIVDRAAANVRRGLSSINDEYEAAERKYNDAKQKAQVAASAVTSAEAEQKRLTQQREAIEEDLRVIKEDRINETIAARDAAAAEIARLNSERAAAIMAGKKNTDTEVVEIDKQLAEGSTKLCDAEAAILKAKETYRTTNLRLQENLKSRLAGYGPPTIQQLLESDLSDAQKRENEQKTKLGSPSKGTIGAPGYTDPTGLYIEKEKTEADAKTAQEEFERVERRFHQSKQTVDGGEVNKSLKGFGGKLESLGERMETGFKTLAGRMKENTDAVVEMKGEVVSLKTVFKQSMEALTEKHGEQAAKALTKLSEIEVHTKRQADAVSKMLKEGEEELRKASGEDEKLKVLKEIERKATRTIEILEKQKPQEVVVAQQEIIGHIYHCNEWIQVTVRTKKSS